MKSKTQLLPQHIALSQARQKAPVPPNLAAELAHIGPADLEFYSPHLVDVQLAHTRDELYVVAEGSGILQVDGQKFVFAKGDVLFVPAHAEHTFTHFSDDFGTWVIFFN